MSASAVKKDKSKTPKVKEDVEMQEDPSAVLQGISSQKKTVKIPNSTDTETITKLLHELGFTLDEFAGRLMSSDDKKVLVVYQTAI